MLKIKKVDCEVFSITPMQGYYHANKNGTQNIKSPILTPRNDTKVLRLCYGKNE